MAASREEMSGSFGAEAFGEIGAVRDTRVAPPDLTRARRAVR